MTGSFRRRSLCIIFFLAQLIISSYTWAFGNIPTVKQSYFFVNKQGGKNRNSRVGRKNQQQQQSRTGELAETDDKLTQITFFCVSLFTRGWKEKEKIHDPFKGACLSVCLSVCLKRTKASPVIYSAKRIYLTNTGGRAACEIRLAIYLGPSTSSLLTYLDTCAFLERTMLCVRAKGGDRRWSR